MKIGMNLPVMVPGLDRGLVLDWSRRIDTGPFSTLAAGERITFPNPEILVTLSAAAAVTERVKIALTVMVLPMHAEAVAAKQVATLDVLSGGRVVMGVGAGAREHDYRSAGAQQPERPIARIEEQVTRMRALWRGEPPFPGAQPVEPLPVQEGGPEILAGSLSPKAIRRAARFADGICGFSFGPSLDEVAASFDAARDGWKQAGRDAPPRLTTCCWFALGPSSRDQMDTYLHRYLGFLGEPAARALAPTVKTTSAQALRDAIRGIADLGADELLLVPTTSDPAELDRVADLL